MAQASLGDVLRHLRGVWAAQDTRDLSDGDLLERFLNHQEDTAFAVLMQRHGPMVMGICRRVTGDWHAAEDALQAAFVVLARRARSIRKRASIAGWLYGVAQRIALRSKTQATARRLREKQLFEMPRQQPLDDLSWQELRSTLDEEVGRLAEKHRSPIVLCYFEGKSHDQAAKELGCPKNTLTNRLTRGRELLRQQLVKRGITLSAGALATSLAEQASAAPVRALLTINTVKAAASIAAGRAVEGGCLSAGAMASAEQMLAGAFWLKAKLVLMVLTLGVAVGLASLGSMVERDEPAKAMKAQVPPVKVDKGGPVKKDLPIVTDLYGDPLPPGATARLGTVRFRPGEHTFGLAFLPGDTVLASAGAYGFGLFLWDAANGQLLHRFASEARFRPALFSPDGKVLLGRDVFDRESIQIIEVATGKVLHRLPIAPSLQDVFSTDGHLVAGPVPTAAGEQRIQLWDLASGNLVRTLEGQAKSMGPLAFSKDGMALAAYGPDKIIRLWDVATGTEIRRFEGQGTPVQSVVFSPDGDVLAAAGEDRRMIGLWDVKTGKLLRRLEADENAVGPVVFAPDGKLLASAGDAGLIRLWDPKTGKELRHCQARFGIRALAFSSDGKMLASVGALDGAIRRWDTVTAKEIDPPSGHTAAFLSLLFTPDGKALFSSCAANVLEWDVASGRERRQLFASPSGPPDKVLLPLAFSADGRLVAQITWTDLRKRQGNIVVRLWDTAMGKEVRAFELPNEGVREGILFSPDAKILAASSRDGVRVWELSKGKELRRLAVQGAGRIAFAPDGKVLAYVDQLTKTIHLCEVATNKELGVWDTQQETINTVVFSPDGKSLVSAGFDPARTGQDVRVWATATGKALGRFFSKGRVKALAFSPNGRVLAVSKETSRTLSNGDVVVELGLWEVASGQEIRQIDNPQGLVLAVAFAPDGRTLATAGDDTTILLWDLAAIATDGKAKPAVLSVKELQGMWSDLAGEARQAETAVWTLALAPKQSLPFLKKQFQVIPAPTAEVAKLIGDLDSAVFAVREKSARTLEQLGESAEGALRKHMDGQPPLEVRRRIEKILEKLDGEVLRKLRAVDAMEHMGTSEAWRLLEDVAQGSPNPRVSEAAKGALARQLK